MQLMKTESSESLLIAMLDILNLFFLTCTPPFLPRSVPWRLITDYVDRFPCLLAAGWSRRWGELTKSEAHEDSSGSLRVSDILVDIA